MLEGRLWMSVRCKIIPVALAGAVGQYAPTSRRSYSPLPTSLRIGLNIKLSAHFPLRIPPQDTRFLAHPKLMEERVQKL
jgi:hypothetical protein